MPKKRTLLEFFFIQNFISFQNFRTLPAILEKSYYRAGSSYYSTGGSIHHINSYLVHPKYIAQEGLNFYIQNDIAIVKVKEPFIYSDTLKPVALDHKYPSNFAKAQISGWGITNVR